MAGVALLGWAGAMRGLARAGGGAAVLNRGGAATMAAHARFHSMHKTHTIDLVGSCATLPPSARPVSNGPTATGQAGVLRGMGVGVLSPWGIGALTLPHLGGSSGVRALSSAAPHRHGTSLSGGGVGALGAMFDVLGGTPHRVAATPATKLLGEQQQRCVSSKQRRRMKKNSEYVCVCVCSLP
jgi:hypothetical protein